MHLSYSTSKYKGKIYKSYSIAESYRKGDKVRKRTIWSIGKLTDEQADQIRRICEVVKGKTQLVNRLADIVVKESRAYLDIAVVNEIWNRWQLDSAFDFDVTNSSLSTALIAKILTINRCTAPCSHYAIPAWAQNTALEDILSVDLSGLNDDKIYYELDKIHKNKISIENHLFKQVYRTAPKSYEFINYDLSTSYFVGYKCKLSAFGKGKIECHGRRQVLLGVLINDQGYPFKWDVYPGNIAEVKTLKHQIYACEKRFKLSGKDVTLVFDRGIISDENALMVSNARLKYISALDRNQIPTCGVSLKPFENLEIDSSGKVAPPLKFKRYDDNLYFQDAGAIDGKRYVVGFNPALFKEDRCNRDEKISYFIDYLKRENHNLSNAKRDRKAEATKNRIVGELKRLKISKYFEDPVLHPLSVSVQLKRGEKKDVKSFSVTIIKKDEIIASDQLLDGVCVFVSNHIERQGRGFKFKPQKVVQAYREKTKVEDVFKNVKSFLKLRPFFVNTNNHVKAVYTVCILGYFINKYLANKRKEAGEKDFLNSSNLYAPFKDIDIATLEDIATGAVKKKTIQLPSTTRSLIQKLHMEHIVYGQEK